MTRIEITLADGDARRSALIHAVATRDRNSTPREAEMAEKFIAAFKKVADEIAADPDMHHVFMVERRPPV